MYVSVHKRAHFCTRMGFITLFGRFRSRRFSEKSEVKISYAILIFFPHDQYGPILSIPTDFGKTGLNY